MTKADVRSFDDLVVYAEERAARSLRRNDPVAWAYWREARKWASGWKGSEVVERSQFLSDLCHGYVRRAKLAAAREDFMVAALEYSRAKWLVIIGRNRGIVMSSRRTGVNMEWLEAVEKRIVG